MKKGILATILLSLILVLAACGGGNNGNNADNNASDNSSASNNLNITASNFEFDQDEYTVKSGEAVTIKLSNEEGMHGLAIDEFDVDIQGEGEATFTPDKPGEYIIHCSVACGQGHDDMKSTLIVE